MRHEPVLMKETIDALNLKPGNNVIDCTLGDAGHSEVMLEKISPNGKLLGIDLDPEAVLRAKQFLYNFQNRVTLARDNFANLQEIITKNDFSPVNAILMDLGWSTPQFEERGRGFSFLVDEALDMRYGVGEMLKVEGEESLTAADVVNTYTEEELSRLFKNFGEENLNKEIARAVKVYRKNKKIEKTGELVEIILETYRQKLKSDKEIPWVGGLHPATKVFQALRIETNHELESLKKALPQAVSALSSGGRLAVITFHSLEDRIVKQYFQSIVNKQVKLINKKPISASEEEVKNNPRSRSAKLRVVEKIHPVK
ncbi:MAG: 16S rRNA (cytosine(1402)-N(4))-methyltransferase [Candidatus Magasanikbacteria bacterium RIFOXYD2_FULL_39_9]|uniref:Ribosomal RNA small subunit methyltransferase H n=1 Tax=Candidatus Magasanikbacteria bacterium RIFOXYD1_FULL_40_23 TaxID=1798705 RepID=A0A1F6PAM0_9BACT|nr:MAG: 16S rRNA (cytosine(1402)-N(4))-methyltransferase [Candidatus Magasanikbacteria bacterium RIFOXYD2_FULL_39_9]OGH93227.1 MAG: 16S rRNA (cytosine(1402)-N(4))-methyltransferase [Candidatus Magasanikbacteria bacterium RIFOXYD1_FULL_40_23]